MLILIFLFLLLVLLFLILGCYLSLAGAFKYKRNLLLPTSEAVPYEPDKVMWSQMPEKLRHLLPLVLKNLREYHRAFSKARYEHQENVYRAEDALFCLLGRDKGREFPLDFVVWGLLPILLTGGVWKFWASMPIVVLIIAAVLGITVITCGFIRSSR